MTTGTNYSDKDGTILVQIPLRLRQRSGRKLVVTPEGTGGWSHPSPAGAFGSTSLSPIQQQARKASPGAKVAAFAKSI